MDEKAALQRQREAEAEARREARKGAPTRVPERTGPSTRADSDKPVGGPPMLPLAGSKPSWRDREAAKAAATTTTTEPSQLSAESEVPTAPTAEPAKRPSGYVPPHLRGRQDGQQPPTARDDSSGGDRWRRRETTRDDSPADGAAKNPSRFGQQDEPRANGAPSTRTGTPPAVPGAGKYVPIHLRNK